MEQLDKETVIKILTAFAVIVAAFVAGMLGFFAQLILKRFDNLLAGKKEKENQKLKFYIPLLRCLYELDDRLDRIVNKQLDSNWLDAKYLDDIKNKKGFASNPNNTGYFIISSIYLIASFFGLTEAIKKGVDTTKFSYNHKTIVKYWNKLKIIANKTLGLKQNQNIFQFDPDISIISRIFVHPDLFNNYIQTKSLIAPVDACKLHKHIQHSIGEMMLEKDGEDKYRVKSFREFYDSYIMDEGFRFWFVLIENLFCNLSNFQKNKSIEKKVELKNDIRPLRLIAIQYWCRILMKNISKELDLDELNLETRPPDDVLINLSDELKSTIKSFKLDNTQTYLLGLKLNN
ncbi:MAG: hypothetical protein M0Q21_08175 [Ignavibacteriaceae bacterium]|nr:hypothetical protein [Ignavibacteriaceae bacterium]